MKKYHRKLAESKYVYLVYCNPTPILYEVYSNKQDAVRYAIFLLRYRKEVAKEKGVAFKLSMFKPFEPYSSMAWVSSQPLFAEGTIFKAQISLEDKRKDSDDNCIVKVERKILR